MIVDASCGDGGGGLVFWVNLVGEFQEEMESGLSLSLFLARFFFLLCVFRYCCCGICFDLDEVD